MTQNQTILSDSGGLFRCTVCGKVHRKGFCEKDNPNDTFKKDVLDRLDRIIRLLEIGLGQDRGG